MKKICSALMIAAVMAACNGNAPETAEAVTPAKDTTVADPDTTGFAEFQALKKQQELMKANEAAALRGNALAATPTKRTTTYASYTPSRRTSGGRYSTTRDRPYNDTYSNSGTTMSSESQNAAKTRKGWSKAAKGAVIGGATGAVAGAVINKRNRAAGAVVGGVLGAGAGYGVGRHLDKKDGRY